jgi:hypothetical protein
MQAKLLAKLINMARAAYVASAGLMSGGTTDIRKALLKKVLASKVLTPSSGIPLGKMNQEDIMKMIQGIAASTKRGSIG